MNVLVVGGSGGIGRAIAERMAGRGHEVGVVARTAPDLRADVLDREGVSRAIGRFAEASNGLDTLVYAAGRFRGVGPIAGVDPDSWWLDVETTLRGFANVVRASIPLLRVSATPSIVALIGPGHAGELACGTGYGAAQAGLARLVESLDVELRPDAIPVYAVNPGLVPTGLMAHLLDSPEGRRHLPRFTEAFAEGKEVGPEVAAEMVAWLAETRPRALGGRVVASMLTPEVMESRLDRIAADDSGKLRLR